MAQDTTEGHGLRATLIYGAGDVRVEDVPDPVLKAPTDALVRVLRSCVCGSELWPYGSKSAEDGPARIGHEFLGVVEETGSAVSELNAEAVRVPQAQGTLVKVPSAVLAARRLGAELQIILIGRHTGRTDLGRDLGATDVVAERGEEGIARVRELTGGDGTHTVLECVGLEPAIKTAFGVVRAGGMVSRVGAPQYPAVPMGFPLDDVPDGYRAMADREALRVLVQP